eukprot:768820-Hanusia_phi.AAC.10
MQTIEVEGDHVASRLVEDVIYLAIRCAEEHLSAIKTSSGRYKNVTAQSAQGTGFVLYASSTHLYVASTTWGDDDEAGGKGSSFRSGEPMTVIIKV